MPRGRFISKSITRSRRVNSLSTDLTRLTFTWLLPFQDCEGRIDADPVFVKQALYKNRKDISIPKVARMLQELHDAELIVLYEVDGSQYAWFPGFAEHQSGIRKDREAPSELPPYCGSYSRVTPPTLQSNDGSNSGSESGTNSDPKYKYKDKYKDKYKGADTDSGSHIPEVCIAYCNIFLPGSAPSERDKQLATRWQTQIPDYDHDKAADAIREWSKTKWESWRKRNQKNPSLAYFENIIADACSGKVEVDKSLEETDPSGAAAWAASQRAVEKIRTGELSVEALINAN